VKGEAKDTGYVGWIELFSFSLGASNPSSVGGSGGSGSGKVSISSFNVMKKCDTASAALFTKCCEGKHFDKAEVILCKAAGSDTPLEFLKYEFEHVFVDSIQWSGSAGGDDVPTETVQFSFGKVTITYKEQKDDGTVGEAIGAGWDVRTNSK
jgi:type VI secretion system secreted protein Hcp